MKKRTSICKEQLLKDIEAALQANSIAYDIDRAMSGSVYFKTKNGDLRVSNHDENYRKLNNTRSYLYYDTPLGNAHYFRTKADKSDYDYKLKLAIANLQAP